MRSALRGVTEPLLTCEAVLAETAFHLGSSGLVLAMLQDGLVRSAFVLNEHISRLGELAARFRVYGRGRREVIPLIHPSQG